MIDSIHFRNFRVLEDATLPLGAFTLLLGPNGSGKTTALRALLLLGDMAREFAAHGSLPAVKEFAGASSLVAFGGVLGGVQARLEFDPDGGAHLGLADGSAVPPAALEWLAGTCGFVLDPAALARPVDDDSGTGLGADGSGLAAVLARMRREDSVRWEALVEEFRRIMPEFSDVLAGRNTRGGCSFSVVTAQGKALASSSLSQGVLVLLGVLAIVFSSRRPTLLCLEEVERGIHPRLLRDIRDLLYRLSFPADSGMPDAPVQVVATTHSPYILDLFADTPEDVVLALKEAGGATFKRLDTIPALREMLETGRLGDLWYSGILGGVP